MKQMENARKNENKNGEHKNVEMTVLSTLRPGI